MGRVGGLSFTGLAAFTERIEDPREYETEHEVEWAVGAILLVDATATAPRRHGRVVLPLLGGDRLQPARQGRWLGHGLHPGGGAMHVGGGSGESATTHTMKILNRVRLYRRRRGTLRGVDLLRAHRADELRRALLGHDKSWPTLRALLRPSTRPAVLGACDSAASAMSHERGHER